MIIGLMRYKIEVLTPALVVDEYNSTKEIYINYITLKAGLKELSGTKTTDNNELFAATRIDWNIYFRKVINEKMRIKYNNKQYRILYIQEIGIKEGLLIQTELIND